MKNVNGAGSFFSPDGHLAAVVRVLMGEDLRLMKEHQRLMKENARGQEPPAEKARASCKSAEMHSASDGPAGPQARPLLLTSNELGAALEDVPGLGLSDDLEALIRSATLNEGWLKVLWKQLVEACALLHKRSIPSSETSAFFGRPIVQQAMHSYEKAKGGA